MYYQGDIVLINFPFTDLSNSKARPAAIVSKKSYNDENEDVLVVGITSQARTGQFICHVTNNDCPKLCKAPKLESWVVCDKVFTLKQSIIIKSIDRLKRNKLNDVLGKVKLVFED